MRLKAGNSRWMQNPKLGAWPGGLMKARQQNECDVDRREDQNGRDLSFHLLPIQPKLGTVSRIDVRRLLVKGKLSIERQQKHE